MLNWKEFEKTKNILNEAGRDIYSEAIGQHHIILRPDKLLRWIEFARDDLGFVVLLDLTGLDHGEDRQDRFELVYHLLSMGTHQRLNLHVKFSLDEIVPSVVNYFSHAGWMEREQAEMFGLNFDLPMEPLLLPGHQINFPLRKKTLIRGWPLVPASSLPLKKLNPNKSETPYPEEAWKWKRFEILDGETMGHFEWMVCFDPNVVVDSRVQIGFHHLGFEKLLEGKNWLQILHLVHKIHEGAAPHYGMAWIKILEDMMMIKIPERAQAIRIIILELSRIAEHLTVLFEICFALKKNEYRIFLDAREKVYELFEKYCGHRQGVGMLQLGGLKDDLPHGWIVEYQTVANILQNVLSLVNKTLTGTREFRDSLGGESLSAQTILQWGVGGPAMRAAGVNYDLRKSQPFYFYHEIDFDIPVGIYGRGYDRYLIRLEEIFQSLRIITQVIDNLPLGVTVTEDFDCDAHGLLKKVSGSRQEMKWHSGSVETPNGEGGFSVSVGDAWKLERVKVKTPSFMLAQALPHLVLGLKEHELKASIASLGMRRTEIDR